MHKILKMTIFSHFFTIFWPLKLVLPIRKQLSNIDQLLYSMYVFYKEKLTMNAIHFWAFEIRLWEAQENCQVSHRSILYIFSTKKYFTE